MEAVEPGSGIPGDHIARHPVAFGLSLELGAEAALGGQGIEGIVGSDMRHSVILQAVHQEFRRSMIEGRALEPRALMALGVWIASAASYHLFCLSFGRKADWRGVMRDDKRRPGNDFPRLVPRQDKRHG